MNKSTAPRAVLFGCADVRLAASERDFFADADPLGFILFQRNCETPDQIRALVAALRDAVGRADAPVLIDQEGGRVARLGPPHWPEWPAVGRIGAVAARDPDMAETLARMDARLIAAELAALGITVDCAPVLDLPQPDAHDIIGDRAFGAEPEQVARLGRAFCEGLLAGGVLPVIKHIPGHGRARADSHSELPVVDTEAAVMSAHDLKPFQALADMPMAMTAHVLYRAWDADRVATISPTVIADIIRGEIGFDGLLMCDDLSMEALPGGLGDRAEAVLAAGCDLVLHCSGDAAEMATVAAASGPMSDAACERWRKAAARLGAVEDIDVAAMSTEFAALLKAGEAAP
jgi:beta-N-acetylhexosaminidase